MSDKPLIQQSLASDLAELLILINPSTPSSQDYNKARFGAAIGFLRGFWEAIVREWNGVDRLRWVLYPTLKDLTHHRREVEQPDPSLCSHLACRLGCGEHNLAQPLSSR